MWLVEHCGPAPVAFCIKDTVAPPEPFFHVYPIPYIHYNEAVIVHLPIQPFNFVPYSNQFFFLWGRAPALPLDVFSHPTSPLPPLPSRVWKTTGVSCFAFSLRWHLPTPSSVVYLTFSYGCLEPIWHPAAERINNLYCLLWIIPANYSHYRWVGGAARRHSSGSSLS